MIRSRFYMVALVQIKKHIFLKKVLFYLHVPK